MKALFIDASTQTVTEINLAPESPFDAARKLIGCDLIECVTIHRHLYPHGHEEVILIDEEGLLRNPEVGFALGEHVFAGSAVIVRMTHTGRTAPTWLEPSDLEPFVAFQTFDEANPSPEPEIIVTPW